jgi:hypothetical protein
MAAATVGAVLAATGAVGPLLAQADRIAAPSKGIRHCIERWNCIGSSGVGFKRQLLVNVSCKQLRAVNFRHPGACARSKPPLRRRTRRGARCR